MKLIDGEYCPDEAREILLSMINSKIQFHVNRDFSSVIRMGKPEFTSRERLKELREAKKKVISLIAEAEKENKVLQIKSSIEVSLTSENKNIQI